MRLQVRPSQLDEANAFVKALHRHHKPATGYRWAISAWKFDSFWQLCGVAIVGRPVARKTDQRMVAEVTRLCTDGTRNACSILYAAAARACEAMGFDKIQTFILGTESGISLKAAGWVEEATTPGRSWSVPSRARVDQERLPLGERRKFVKIFRR